jgi:mono/diheme cytochrome c family protein
MFRGTRVQLLSVAVLPLGLGFAVYGAPSATIEATLTPGTAIAGPVSYAGQIAPLFEATCVSCHGAETKEAGLALHTYAAVMAGSEFGTVVEAGNPAGSLLIDMIAAGEMPQDADALSPEQVALVRSWIQAGANNN